MKRIDVLKKLYLIEGDEGDGEYPDFSEVLDVVENQLDTLLSMMESYVEGNELMEKYFERVDSDYENFLLSLKSFVSLMDVDDE